MATRSTPLTISPKLVIDDYDLRTAVLLTLAYSDVFDYPLTLEEIHRYLIGHGAKRNEVHDAVSQASTDKQVANGGAHYALRGRHDVIALREKRAQTSAKLWLQALRYGRLIARLPFVRMVAVTGALVSDNAEAGADLDYLIVTRPGYLWLTRAIILGIDKVARRLGSRARLCPNFIVSETNLALQERDLFTAQELTRMVPISGLPVYRRMRSQNGWTDEFLPNAQGFPRSYGNGSGPSRLQAASEALLSNPVSRKLERWEMERKIRKFTRSQTINNETRFSADLCKGHFDGHKEQTMRAFESRIEQLGLR